MSTVNEDLTEEKSEEKSDDKLKVVICWHMHQPEYRDLRKNEYQLPWTYLHVIKDYVDMVDHLENIPGARAVVNFTPTLLEQIEDYKEQIKDFLRHNTPLRDPLLASLTSEKLPSSPQFRLQLINDCLRANRERLIDRFPAYQKLANMSQWFIDNPDTVFYLHEQYLFDMLTWHHLAWIGETVKRNDPRIKRLLYKESDYTLNDRYLLLEVIGDIHNNIIDRYRRLAQTGQIELSVTPYAHPIMPLMLDINSAREAMPDVPLPEKTTYPGGKERVHWHIKQGLDIFKNHFGFKPVGCWPSEGAVSDETLKILAEYGFQWVATGGSVLNNSLSRADMLDDVYNHVGVHRAYTIDAAAADTQDASQTENSPIQCFFRDDGLSDLIGFTYSKWHADDAVGNLVEHLETIVNYRDDQRGRVVSIILDGENAWEHYPENGYYFLTALYQRLAEHPDMELSTFADCVTSDVTPTKLPSLVAGSWVYGSFSTWIGDRAKNRGWDMLIQAKECFDSVVARRELDPGELARAEQQLAVCEGSDWFWWFGDYNPADSVSSFESLFRLNLSILYQYLGVLPPSYLTQVFTQGSGSPAGGGTMRPGKE
ncbi:glycoside hydrolase family 57 protein [sulfur-oxidizing endosymbiont of Gigantopelta aegis]|uniref:glycoside hydrolase family 57 protein n=1 Tax=sulfur-oxidizing endosymbiont of Gigantopelta aegis TaxID=2794934 RepID=UPI001FE49733|nr:glycoside hydrolase family 57 protein [sulfur-oxidizing endosymbiont of Gigantopelta aegis]